VFGYEEVSPAYDEMYDDDDDDDVRPITRGQGQSQRAERAGSDAAAG
jgi:hypothetical protein